MLTGVAKDLRIHQEVKPGHFLSLTLARGELFANLRSSKFHCAIPLVAEPVAVKDSFRKPFNEFTTRSSI